MLSQLRSRRIRWAAPVVVSAVIGLMAVVPTLSAGADDTPTLPTLSAEALLAKAEASKTADLPGLSGTIRLSVNAGIPDLGGLGGAVGGDQGFNPTTLLSGVHSADISASKDGFKATYSDSPTTEDDVISNGKDLWIWQSQGTKVTHVVLPANQGGQRPADSAEPASPVKTPDQVAQSILSAVGPSTDVTVGPAVYVANHRAAYELVLAPKAGSPSTVDHVSIAVDDATGKPIQVQVFAKNQKASALDFGFSSLTIGTQDKSQFTFTPPPNANVTTKVLSSGSHPTSAAPDRGDPAAGGPGNQAGNQGGNQPTIVGQDWTSVAVFHNPTLPPQINELLDRVATSVPGGKLVSTALVNVLFLSNGNVAVGAVSSDALVKAAAPFAG